MAGRRGEVDLGAGYVPLPAQRAFHQSVAKYRMYSGGFGSGKTLCGTREAIYKAFQYPGSFGLVGRLRFTDLELSTQRTFFAQLDQMGLNRKPYVTGFNSRTQIVSFGNGSEIVFRALDNPDKLLGIEYSWGYVDEGSEVPDAIYQTLVGRIRYQAPLQLWITTNPGASGWIRDRFINRKLPGFEMFHAPTTENIHLPKEYVESMFAQYPEVWRKRFLEGDWSAFEGQVFTQADPKNHVIDSGWVPTADHDIYEGWDFGYRNPTATVWIALHPSGEEPAVVFAEHQEKEWLPSQHSAAVRQIRQRFKLREDKIVCFGDPAGAQRQGITGLSYFQEYANHGIYISSSTKEPRIRALRIGKMLDRRIITREGTLPAMVFTRDAHRTWDQIIGYRFRENRSTLNEDPKEEFYKRDDHLVDALGYAAMALPPPDEEQPKPRLRLGITSRLTVKEAFAEEYPLDAGDEFWGE